MNTLGSPDKMTEMRLLGADWWNDSCDLSQLAEAVSQGATGATSNPVIVEAAVRADKARWLPFVKELSQSYPQESEDELAWRLIAEMGRQASKILLPVFERTKGEKGYLSLQVNPKYNLDPEKMFSQAMELASLAPNIAIKLPATKSGLEAVESLIAQGVAVNVTVSFSVAQAIAAAEAIERGLKTYALGGSDETLIHPYVTIMTGRVGDHLERVSERDGIEVESEDGLILSGVLVFKHAARIFRDRDYQSTLLAAAYRHELQWSQIIGREVLQSIPYAWWHQFRESNFAVRETLWEADDGILLQELLSKFPDFGKVYLEDGMTIDEFGSFGATESTLNQFILGYESLLEQISAAMGE